MQPFAAVKITDKVYWVGAIDWELRNFHGYGTFRGTTYNAFLILGTKPILVDTVKAPFFKEMLARIQSVIDPKQIRYIISNHAEMDHSGCLSEAIALIQPERVFASKAGVNALKDHFHFTYEITAVNDGEAMQLGDNNLKFIDTKMLHWPDSMFTYFANDKILFSQDGFGMHFATANLFTDLNDFGIIKYESAKYFANILLPYAAFVTKLLDKLPQLQLDIAIIAPDHGPLWRGKENITWIIDSWRKWALQNYYAKAVVIYDSMWNSTAKMANAIADGLSCGGVSPQVMQLTVSHRSDVITELLEAGALLVGSPTLNQEIFPTVADILCYIRGLKPRNLIGQIFGSYGWAGEATKILTSELQRMQVELVGEPISVKYVPTDDVLRKCRILGQNVANVLQQKLTK
jgi:flavorubredoxin